MSKKSEPEKIDLSEKEVENLKKRLEEGKLSQEERELLGNVLQGFVWLSKMLQAKKLSIKKLSRLFGIKTEKNKKSQDKFSPKADKKKSPSSNGGRRGQDDYDGAKRVFHEHEELSKGDRCPGCLRGNLYEVALGSFVNVKGAPPLSATVHEVQKLRCGACGYTYTAQTPKEVRKQKYDETADVAIALMRYGTGVPLHRQEKWQEMMGVPLPSSTAWDRVEELASSLYPAYEKLIEQASQSRLSFIDDTTARITLLKKALKQDGAKRCGLYTTGINARVDDKIINLFMTGNRHAGENLDRLLERRKSELSPMVRMSDALSNNKPKLKSVVECLCLVHARRQFIDAEVEGRPESEHVILEFGKIFRNEKEAVEKGLSDIERLSYHQKRSEKILRKLRRWCLKKFYLKKIEPNSPLGGAIQYLLNHWKGLTQFLRIPGAPLENNIAERLLKSSIRHRKNSLFYRTQLGAYVGDVVMSLIETCRAMNKNPFNYLVALHRNKKMVHQRPELCLPWNYEANLLG